ncbi:MAG: acetylornithine deacetylase/succinyl-diaminopimelate desuccinylase-like protein [Gammaproteobacteria bacterium]|jgi:acetylornithine deacetylase/succinyl-diaminopimelate desuccinylase-like protein
MIITKNKYFTLMLVFCMILMFGCGQDNSDPEPVASSTPAPLTETSPSNDSSAELAIAKTETSDLLPHQQMAKDFLKELVEIDTTHSTGDATKAAQAMADRLIAAGFPRDDVQVLTPVPGKGNLVARYRGKGKDLKPLLLLAHLDVVEANPADWEFNPFIFTEKDGYYYGRGSMDDKDEAAIHIANLIRLKEEGYQPTRDIIVALTADEEGGPHNGAKWLAENHRDLIDAEYALNEGGGGAMKQGRYLSNAVQASEKVYQTFTIEFTNSGGHSSLPVKDNAIYHLADALAKIRDYDFPVKLNEVTHLFFERSAELESGPLRSAMRGVLQSPPDAAAIAFLADKPFYNSRLRTTCVATKVNAGHRDNALPQRANATVNCRVLPGESIDDVENTLRYVVGDEGMSIARVTHANPSPPSPLTPELLGIMESITESMWPGVPVIPTMSAGATDAAFLRNAGIPVYGVSGLFNDIEDNRMHGQNERIEIKTYFEGQEFLYRLTKQLTQ